jgi:tetratricopeptide (TPR) repeat protein
VSKGAIRRLASGFASRFGPRGLSVSMVSRVSPLSGSLSSVGVIGWRHLLPSLVGVFLACATPACADDVPKQKLDQIFQTAVADYQAGRYSEAVGGLERVLPYAGKSYEVHELLGLTYAALQSNAKAEAELKIAVQLNPNSSTTRINFGTLLLHSGKGALAIEQFREALQLDPQSYDANHDLGELYAATDKIDLAQPLLDSAQRLRPDSYDNGYDLAMADFLLGKLQEARQVAAAIEQIRNTGEVHNLLAQIDEKDGKYVDAANEYEIAAHLDPSEENFFYWGSEMLLHRTYEPAIEIFHQATARYPRSARLFVGLGLSLYSRGIYDEAVQALLTAADLTPADPRCYSFLASAYDASPKEASAVTDAFRRYANLRPNDARAQYYLAMSLWKGNRTQGSTADSQTVEGLLTRSIKLDDSIAEARVQLGDLYADQHEYDKSIPQYVRAIELNPNLSDAHYRLGTDYVHVGRKDDAQKEFAVYQKLRAQHLAEVEKERAEVLQFVVSERASSAAKP